MENLIKISVIIPVYNGESYIKKCLDVLAKQDFDEPYEMLCRVDCFARALKNELTHDKQDRSKTNSPQSTSLNRFC